MILGYVRVSTIEQAAEDRTSMQEQEKVIYGYAMTQGIDRFGVQIYADAGVSASIPLKERPEGSRLLSDAQPGDTIIASKMDRLFRSARDALETVDYCKANGINVVLFDMGIESVTGDGMARVFLTMAAAFAEFERGRIRERMIQGKAAKAEKGGHIGGAPAYGYRVIGEGRSATLEEHPSEQAVIDIVRSELGPSFSSRAVMKKLKAKGYRSRTGKPFYTFQVQRIVERLQAN